MRRLTLLILMMLMQLIALAQHTFRGTSLSEALIELDSSSKRYDIMFVYDELEDFTVTKTIGKGCSLPDAVREICGFYPVKVLVEGHEIYVECLQKQRTKLTGRLIDGQGKPVAYANVTLFLLTDSTMIGGGVSNEAGDFVIPCAAERVRARISCIRFKTIERIMPVSQVGTICMQTENYHLSTVMVNGRSSVIRSERGGLQYVVANDPFAQGQNALELIKRIPPVLMSEGRVSILGKGTARLMLNGRMTEQGDEAMLQRLWTLRAEDIERIEVISIPSGRYQTDAGNGYINVVMKRDQATGWRGYLTGQLSSSDDWSGRLGGNLNYTSKTLDISLGVDGGRVASATNKSWEFLNTFQRFSVSRTESLNKNFGSNVMLRYLPHDRLELGTFVSYQSLHPSQSIDNMLWIDSYQIDSHSTQHHDGNRSLNLTAYSDWKIDNKGKLLSLTYNYYNKNDDSTTRLNGESENSNIDRSFLEIESLMNESGLNYKIQSYKLDLSLPFRPFQVDAGVAYTMIDNESSCKIQTIDITNLYQERTISAYLSVHKQWKSLAAKAGLRYEYTKFNGEKWLNDIYVSYSLVYNHYELSSPLYQDAGFNQSTNRLLPSLCLNYHTSQGHKWGIQWGMSILRPNFYDLNPSLRNMSPMDNYAGSPHLMPSYTNSIELNYQGRKGLNTVVYFLHGSNQVEWITAFKFSGHGNMTRFSRPENCYNSDRTGFSLSYQAQPLSRLNVLAESDISYYDAWIPSVPPLWAFENSERQGLHGWEGKLSLSADLFLNSQRTLMFSARYNQWTKHYLGLIKFGSYSSFHFALRYSMLDERLKLSLVADDPFHQHVTDAESYYEHRVERDHVNHHSHSIGLIVSYSFGGKVMRHTYRDMKNTETNRAEK